ncbi:hypothetical protein [Humisphaera borealis]|uniref:Uncharacterized protein n=1 Tax=Humisphaera borealis TaxID=2807512 RepID=A0A7M2WVH3_9BACT|nr:hypothetical protein [Humisphaera borealis]QOV89485.1 hypothetical protein IPV69_25370 [Humisphaera borealis]
MLKESPHPLLGRLANINSMAARLQDPVERAMGLIDTKRLPIARIERVALWVGGKPSPKVRAELNKECPGFSVDDEVAPYNKRLKCYLDLRTPSRKALVLIDVLARKHRRSALDRLVVSLTVPTRGLAAADELKEWLDARIVCGLDHLPSLGQMTGVGHFACTDIAVSSAVACNGVPGVQVIVELRGERAIDRSGLTHPKMLHRFRADPFLKSCLSLFEIDYLALARRYFPAETSMVYRRRVAAILKRAYPTIRELATTCKGAGQWGHQTPRRLPLQHLIKGVSWNLAS